MEAVFKLDVDDYVKELKSLKLEAIEAYTDEIKQKKMFLRLSGKALAVLSRIFLYTKQMHEDRWNTPFMMEQILNILSNGEYRYLMCGEKSGEKELEMSVRCAESEEVLVWAAKWLEYYYRVYEKPYADWLESLQPAQMVKDIEAVEPKGQRGFFHAAAYDSDDQFPIRLYRYMEQYIVGQPELKLLALVIHRYVNLGIRENNIALMKGPTGCGKNYAIDVIASFEEVSREMVVMTWDASQITPTGFTGSSIEDIIVGFQLRCQHEHKSSDKGIIFLNEIDKLMQPNFSASGENVNAIAQQQLLCAVEGKSVIKGVDTAKILFILGGSFGELDQAKKEKKAEIGFMRDEAEKDIPSYMEKSDLRHEMVRRGAQRELIGRVNTIINLRRLEKEDIRKILLHPQTGIILRKQEEFSLHGMELEFTDDAIDRIADAIMQEDLGARSAVNIVNELVDIHEFEMFQNGYSRMIVHAGMLERGEPPRFEKGGNTHEAVR